MCKGYDIYQILKYLLKYAIFIYYDGKQKPTVWEYALKGAKVMIYIKYFSTQYLFCYDGNNSLQYCFLQKFDV